MNLITRVFSVRKKLILLFAVLGIATSALYNEVVPPVYQTHVSLLFELPDLASNSGVQTATRDLHNFLEEIRGQSVAGKIAAQIPASLLAAFKAPSGRSDTLDYYSDRVHQSLSAAIIPNTDIIRIAVATSEPKLGYAIAEQAVIVVNRLQTNSGDSLDVQEIFADQLAHYKKAVAAAEEQLRAFKKNTAGITLTNASRENLRGATEADVLSDELALEEKTVRQKLQHLDGSVYLLDSLGIDVRSSELMSLQRAITQSQLSVLQNRIQGLAESDARFQSSKASLQQTRNTFADRIIDLIEAEAAQNPRVKLNSNLTESINLQITLADIHARKEACTKIISGYDEQVSSLSPDQIELTNLIRKKDVNERIYLMLLEKQEAARIRSLENRARVRVIDTPRLQKSPASPNKPRNLILGLGLGLICGLLVAVRRERSSSDLTGESIQASVPWPLLSSIPRTENDWLNASINGEGDAAPESVEVEAYRELRTNLKFLNQDDPNVLLVTSLRPGAGKSTITANLAVSYTRLGLKVLLVDAAIRQPSLHEIFGLNQEPGLTDILVNHQTLVSDLDDEERRQRFYETGTGSPLWSSIQNLKRHKNVSDLVENFQDFSADNQNNNTKQAPSDMQYLNFLRVSLIESIQSTRVKNLKVLASGKPLSHFSELVSSRSMNWLLDVTRNKYDVILIDSAPLLLVPDSKVLSTLVDGTILVLDTESQRKQLVRAVRNLEKSKIKVAGIVMNKVNPEFLLKEKYSF